MLPPSIAPPNQTSCFVSPCTQMAAQHNMLRFQLKEKSFCNFRIHWYRPNPYRCILMGYNHFNIEKYFMCASELTIISEQYLYRISRLNYTWTIHLFCLFVAFGSTVILLLAWVTSMVGSSFDVSLPHAFTTGYPHDIPGESPILPLS